jgi:hypothetical protein
MSNNPIEWLEERNLMCISFVEFMNFHPEATQLLPILQGKGEVVVFAKSDFEEFKKML